MPAADPLRLLWQHLGMPAADDVTFDPVPVTCARCGTATAESARLTAVISDKFTGWDTYANGNRDPRWCPACAWGHVDPALRHYPWFVTPETAGRANPTMLRALLSLGSLDPQTALIVPLSRKKHLLPDARWGVITTDGVHLPWTHRDADRLPLLLTLHRLGFSETALLATTPRFEHLRTLTTEQQASILRTWHLLDPWRTYPALMQIALRATRKDLA